MNSLDTEIRRAIGELANAAPPAREPESFRRESGDDASTTITTAPITTAPTAGLTGDALLDELSGRRWVALERFDDPSPTARTPEFTVTSSSGAATVDGFDGCTTYSGSFELNGATVETGEFMSTGGDCDVETLGFGGAIELLPGADALLLSDRDGSPLARFHDVARLTPASAADMSDIFFGDDGWSAVFAASGEGSATCATVAWEGSAEGVRVELLEYTERCLFGGRADEGQLGEWMAEVTEPGADVFVTPDGILLANASSTLQRSTDPAYSPDRPPAEDENGLLLDRQDLFALAPTIGGRYLVIDGTVAGFGASQPFCPRPRRLTSPIDETAAQPSM